jgi:type VI secretion system protein ImpM
VPIPLIVGFYGKLPARGDFVRAGLPRDFTDRWDDWLQSVLAGSRALMGDAWLPAFLEAPVWRFALPAGMCGASAVLGLMLPSVDKAGRYFPLTFAALGVGVPRSAEAVAWLDLCEAAGRDALAQDTAPQEISDRLGLPELPDNKEGNPDAVWWSEGSPRVKPARMVLSCLPDAATYAAMLGAAALAEQPTDTAGQSEQHAPGGTGWKPTS